MYFVGHTLCDSSDHKAQLQFGGEFSIPHGAPWTLAVFTGALKSGGCVCRYFLYWCGFRKLCLCIQKKSDTAPFSAIALPQECSEAFRLLIKMYFNCLIERHLISSCSASRSVCLWCCGNLGHVGVTFPGITCDLYFGVQSQGWHPFVPAVQYCGAWCAGMK